MDAQRRLKSYQAKMSEACEQPWPRRLEGNHDHDRFASALVGHNHPSSEGPPTSAAPSLNLWSTPLLARASALSQSHSYNSHIPCNTLSVSEQQEKSMASASRRWMEAPGSWSDRPGSTLIDFQSHQHLVPHPRAQNNRGLIARAAAKLAQLQDGTSSALILGEETARQTSQSQATAKHLGNQCTQSSYVASNSQERDDTPTLPAVEPPYVDIYRQLCSLSDFTAETLRKAFSKSDLQFVLRYHSIHVAQRMNKAFLSAELTKLIRFRGLIRPQGAAKSLNPRLNRPVWNENTFSHQQTSQNPGEEKQSKCGTQQPVADPTKFSSQDEADPQTQLLQLAPRKDQQKIDLSAPNEVGLFMKEFDELIARDAVAPKPNNWMPVGDAERTLVNVLKRQGYRKGIWPNFHALYLNMAFLPRMLPETATAPRDHSSSFSSESEVQNVFGIDVATNIAHIVPFGSLMLPPLERTVDPVSHTATCPEAAPAHDLTVNSGEQAQYGAASSHQSACVKEKIASPSRREQLSLDDSISSFSKLQESTDDIPTATESQAELTSFSVSSGVSASAQSKRNEGETNFASMPASVNNLDKNVPEMLFNEQARLTSLQALSMVSINPSSCSSNNPYSLSRTYTKRKRLDPMQLVATTEKGMSLESTPQHQANQGSMAAAVDESKRLNPPTNVCTPSSDQESKRADLERATMAEVAPTFQPDFCVAVESDDDLSAEILEPQSAQAASATDLSSSVTAVTIKLQGASGAALIQNVEAMSQLSAAHSGKDNQQKSSSAPLLVNANAIHNHTKTPSFSNAHDRAGVLTCGPVKSSMKMPAYSSPQFSRGEEQGASETPGSNCAGAHEVVNTSLDSNPSFFSLEQVPVGLLSSHVGACGQTECIIAHQEVLGDGSQTEWDYGPNGNILPPNLQP